MFATLASPPRRAVMMTLTFVSSSWPVSCCRWQARLPASQEEDGAPNLPYLRPEAARGEKDGTHAFFCSSVGLMGTA